MAIKRYGQNLKPDLSLNKVETYDFTSDEMFGFEQDEEMKVAVASEFAGAAVARNTINNLTSTDTDKALSANQGKILKDAQDVLNGDVATEGSVLKDIKDNAEDATFTDTSGLDSTTIANAINEIYAEKATANGIATLDATGKIPAAQLPTTAMEYKGSWDASSEAYPTTPDAGDFWIVSVAGTTEGEEYDVGDAIIYNGATWDKINKIEIAEEVSLTSDLYTATEVKSALEEIAGLGRTTETVKGNADAIATLETAIDTNRLYSDSQYLALKAKADSLQVKCNTLQAEVYTDDPILQYGAVEIIGDGYEADGTSIDVSSNVVDGSLEMEQKGLTATNSFQSSPFITSTESGITYTKVNNLTWNINGTASGENTKSIYANADLIDGHVYYFNRYTNCDGQLSIRAIGMFSKTLDLDVVFTAVNSTNTIHFLHSASAVINNVTIKPLLIDLTALGLDHITDTDILAKLLPYVEGTQNVGKMGVQILDADDNVTQTIFLPEVGNRVPNGTADSIKTVADGWEHSKRVSTPASVASGVAVNTTNYPTAKNTGQWVNELTAGGTEIGVVGTDSTTGAGMLRFELATPIVTKYDLPHLTSGKTIHRFAGEEKIALYGTGLTFSENVLSVLSAVKFVAGVMTDITDLATITGDTVTFSGVSATDVVYVKVEHDVDRPLGVLEHTPAVSNTASRLKAIEDWIALQS